MFKKTRASKLYFPRTERVGKYSLLDLVFMGQMRAKLLMYASSHKTGRMTYMSNFAALPEVNYCITW